MPLLPPELVVDPVTEVFFELETEADPDIHSAYDPRNPDHRYGKRGIHIENLLLRMSHTRCDDL